MIGPSTRRLTCAGLAIGLFGIAVAASTSASAECMRRVYNRSTFVLVARRDGGPPVTILPGQFVQLRLYHPGEISLAAYCGTPGPDGELRPIVERSFDYEVQLDRCFIQFGGQPFAKQIGRGFIALQGTAPFTVNNPQQGDVILGPFASEACPVLNRGG